MSTDNENENENENENDPMAVLYRSAISGDTDTVKCVLHKHRELLEDHDCMNMLFHHVAGADQVEMLSLLTKDFGLDVNAPKDDKTPEGALDFASSKGAIRAIRWLLDHGAKINHQVDGKTRCFALGAAVRGGHLDVVKLLVERGADINAVWAGMNALHFALMYKKDEVANFLRSQGALLPDQLAKQAESTSPN